MKTTLTLKPVNGGPFNNLPAQEIELPDERILCNDIILPHDRNNFHGTRLFVIGNEYGALGAVWANNDQEAFDELVDADLGAALLIEEKDVEIDADGRETCGRLGNAGEPANLDYAWIQEVRLDGPQDWELIARFAEARGCGAKTLDS